MRIIDAACFEINLSGSQEHANDGVLVNHVTVIPRDSISTITVTIAAFYDFIGPMCIGYRVTQNRSTDQIFPKLV